MNNTFLTICFFLFYIHQSFSQTNIDSLLNSLESPEEKIDFILNIDEDRTDFVDYLDKGILIARKNKLEERLAKVLHYRAFNALFDKKLDDYKKYEDESIAIFLKLGHKKGIVNHYSSEAMYGQYKFAKGESVDSIYRLAFFGFKELEQIDNQIKTLTNWSQYTFGKGRHQFTDSLIIEGEKLLKSSEKSPSAFGLYNSKLIYYGERDLFDSAIVAGNKALEHLDKNTPSNSFGRLNVNIANMHLRSGYYEKAMTHFVSADSIFKLTGFTKGQLYAKGNIATLFLEIGQGQKALNYSKRALNLAIEAGEQDLSTYHYRVGNILVSIDSTNFKDQVFHYNEAKKCAEKLKQNDNLVSALNGLAVVAKNKGQYGKAIRYLDEALLLAKRIKSRSVFNLLYVKAKVLYLTKKYSSAIQLINQALKIPNRSESSRVNLYQWQSNSYREIGNYKAALEFKERAYHINDSIAKSVNFDKITEIEERYESEKKEAENQLLLKDKQIQKATISKQNTAIVGGGLALGLISILSYFLFRQREKARNLNINLANQRDQISFMNKELNHRVKNNLAFMTSLLQMQGRRTNTEEARQVIKESESRLKALSLVHTNLFKNQHDTDINLKEYLIEIIDHLESIFSPVNRSLNIIHDFIDFTIDAEDGMRIGLIVNELVTNSVKHAFNDVENPEIAISTHLDNKGRVTLRYRDNGPGVQSKVLTSAKQTESLGLRLVEILQKQLEDKVSLMFV